jgi:plastocyanin
MITLFACACSGTKESMTSANPTAPTPPVQVAPPTPPAPPSPPLTASVAIRDSGFSPSEVIVAVGGRVTFTNADSRPHDMLGGPDHTRLDCSEVDVVGFLVPGQSRETRVFETPRVCEFHDHNNLGNPAFQGRILVR